jgi:putative ABC transport system permease protein
MSFVEAIRSALAALRAHKLRSALTMLGIVIGVAAVIAMMAAGGGAREQVIAQIRSLGANLLIIQPGNVTSGGVRLGAGAASTLSDEDTAAILREIPAVQVTAAFVRGREQVVAGGTNWSAPLFGIDGGWFEAREWEPETGRAFEPDELARGAQVALLGQTVARSLFGDSDPVGETIRVRNVPFQVIGVMARKGQSSFGTDQDDVVFVPMDAARNRVMGRNRAAARSVSSIYVKVREGESLQQVEEEARTLLRQMHRLQPGQDDDFQIRNLADIAATREASARTLAFLLAAAAAVSLIVGGIGIMNIMLVSVSERTREIGLRLAVGARPRDILRQFLIEAVTLSTIGGAAGLVLGIGAAYVVAAQAGWPLLVEPQIAVLAVVFSALVGIFFGWYPAKRASGLDPVEALRAV